VGAIQSQEACNPTAHLSPKVDSPTNLTATEVYIKASKKDSLRKGVNLILAAITVSYACSQEMMVYLHVVIRRWSKRFAPLLQEQ